MNFMTKLSYFNIVIIIKHYSDRNTNPCLSCIVSYFLTKLPFWRFLHGSLYIV